MGDRILVEVELTDHGSEMYRQEPDTLGLDISFALGERDEKFMPSQQRRYLGARVLTEEEPL